MDDDGGLNIRNWGYYEPSLKGHLGLQLMSNMAERDTKSLLSRRDSAVMVSANGAFLHERDTKPLLSRRDSAVMVSANGAFLHERDTKPLLSRRDSAIMVSANGVFHHRDCGVAESSSPMEYMRESWINPRDKFLHVLPGNPNFSVLSEASGAHPLQILQPPDSSKDERVAQMEEVGGKKDGDILKKRPGGRAQKSPKAKKTKRAPAVPKDESTCSGQRARSEKNTGVFINGVDMDISGIPIPVCSCTGTPQQCYRWGCGGWQSACCTTSMSIYPLPMSTKRRGARIAGRKMSQGAFKKVLEKLAAEGYNISIPIDLRTYWAKHGTNKFVTIRAFTLQRRLCGDCFLESFVSFWDETEYDGIR
ncbi:hypothetical protein HHK36_024177 [Tetracentron sinense]|uniref:GAGA-binding transcriptional activator n=1 Tax=Tetracentron sinense TaxID=13715 RepID=A0A835D3W4_TETSI|nr:hypothetical protein HHK36_024177 [Tetracentron sinense]